MTTLLRAQLFHTPKNPFVEADALERYEDGAVAFTEGRIQQVGSFAELRAHYPGADVVDEQGCILLPGLIDTHVHYPQVRIVGAMGLRLLDWLSERTLPEEARLADVDYALDLARAFVRSLLRNGTTTALVFGSHFRGAQAVLFEEATRVGLRMTSGLVVSDRGLRAELEHSPQRCYEESKALLERWHDRARLRYAVTPRFSVSCSEALLEVCGALMREHPGVFFQTHLNESKDEIRVVKGLFPWASDYLETYERFGLVGPQSVFAHDVHVTEGELSRLAKVGAGVAHCPSSNAFIGSGLFDMARHLAHGVPFALGTDVGGGTGFSLLKEGLMAYQTQMLRSVDDEGYPLSPVHLLHLATQAGANLLELGGEVGSLAAGKSADFVLLRPPEKSNLAEVLAHSPSAEASLGALFTLAREDCVREVYLAGEPKLSSLLSEV